jgi:hypothetical protein
MSDWGLRKTGVFICFIIAAVQCAAWYFGKNGTVFAFTSLTIGAIAGSIFGFSVNLKLRKIIGK